MTIRTNYNTRALTPEGTLHGVQGDHLIDTLEFDLPSELADYGIALELVASDATHTLSASVALTTPFAYALPNTVTCYPTVYYQIVATHADTRCWRSAIGTLTFTPKLDGTGSVPMPDADAEAARVALAAELTSRGIATASDATWATVVANVAAIP